MDILATLLDGPKLPTRISQACNLNYDSFLKWANILESNGLITKTTLEGREAYSLTPAGQQVYRDYRSLMERLRAPRFL